MPSINMIAPRRAEKLRIQRDMRRLLLVILAELVFVFALVGWAFTSIITTNARVRVLNDQIASLQPVVSEIKGYESAISKLQPKLTLLNDAKAVTMRWYNTLDQLTQSMPESTYLQRISTLDNSQQSDKKDGSRVNLLITGVSATQAQVGEMMLRIERIQDLNKVELHYTRDTTVSQYPTTRREGGSQRQVQTLGFEFEVGSELKLSDPKGAKDGANQS